MTIGSNSNSNSSSLRKGFGFDTPSNEVAGARKLAGTERDREGPERQHPETDPRMEIAENEREIEAEGHGLPPPLHLGSAVALGVLLVQCVINLPPPPRVSFE